MSLESVRAHVVALLSWADAHVSFEDAVAGLEREQRTVRPPGMPYSAWELVEHLRITQRDILDYCLPEPYVEREWPAGYWPSSDRVPAEGDWEGSISAYLADRAMLVALAQDAAIDLLALVPHGSGSHTYLRELLVVADHNAYHIGEIVAVRRALGAWPSR